MTLAGDGRVFVCEQAGKLRVIKNGGLLATPFVSLTVDPNGERGLLGVALDPNFAQNQYVYIYYTVPSPAHNRLSRFTANGDVAVAGSELILLDLDGLSSATNHNGGALHFGLDGQLYVAVGENANPSNSQTLTNLLGKVLRVGVPPDPLIPPDNPFVGQATGNNQLIWTLGMRNPFTFAVQPETGRIFINDVGQSTWEEINDGFAGDNYGWPTCEGPFLQGTSTPCGHPEFTSPFYYYGHGPECSIAGGDFYNPQVSQFPASYIGRYFFADYCGNWIHYVDPMAGSPTATTFATGLSSPVDIIAGYDGALYYLQRGGGSSTGTVSKITYTGSSAPAITEDPVSQLISVNHPVTFSVVASGAPPLTYQWQKAVPPGSFGNILGATSSSYTIASVLLSDNLSQYRCVVSNASGSATSAAAILTVTSDQPPAPTILTPASGTTYAAGDTINFSGSATDPEDGTEPASRFTWWVNFHHDTHFHPFMPPTSGITSGSFVIPTIGETSPNVWYRIHLLVEDSHNPPLTTEVYRDVLPRTVTMTFATNPSGLQLTLDGSPFVAPNSVVGVVGIQRTISAPSPQGSSVFLSWSDGGAQTHNISTPATNTTYTATFTGGAPTPTPTRTPTRTPTPTPPPGGLPPPWLHQDIGAVGIPGNATFASGTFTLTASGADIETTADEFHYVYQTLNGDGTIQARVATIQNTDPWAKGGVMIRETLAANSTHAMMVLTPGNGVAFQRRVATGGITTSTQGANVAAPYWVKIVRSGTTFSGYSSPDGISWTLVGSDTISMATSVFIGMPLTSHNDGLLCTATIDNVTVVSGSPTPTPTPTRTPTPGGPTPTPTRTPTPSGTPGPQPTISFITPTSGSAAGGTSITIFGGNFLPASTVQIGGADASTTFVNFSQLKAVAPALSPGTLNTVVVSNPGILRISGSLLNGWMADFTDVPQSNPFHPDIEKLFRNAITAGCMPGAFCPTSPVLRSQLAVFLLRSKHGAGYSPPPCTGVFADVPCPSTPSFPYSDWIEQLATEGITGGCQVNPLLYCPDRNVTRAEMAPLLLKAEHGTLYRPPACTGVFADVPCPATPSFPFSDWIERLLAEGVTAGCAPPPPGGLPSYCPDASTEREQMATFLVRTFGLP